MGEKKYQRIFSQVIAKIKPTEKDKEQLFELFNRIKDFIKSRFGVDSDLLGSAGKNTFLRGEHDLDIFLFFDRSVERAEMEKKALEIGEEVFKKFKGTYIVEYAEHPYTKGKINGIVVEIVPCYRISNINEMKSSVDRTPFHRKWVLENLDERQKDEVRLLKAFLKAQGLYGSSLKTLGFSGYLCEILIAYYKDFENLLKNALKWQFKEFIDPEKHYKNKRDALKKFKEPFIVIDPVDKDRNVASVLSEENFSKFIFKAWQFLKNPDIEFFVQKEKKLNKSKIKEELKKHGKIIIFEFKKPKLIEDILYPQLRKVEKKALHFFKTKDFDVVESAFFVSEKVFFAFEFKYEKIPVKKIKVGPKIYKNFENVERFIEKYKKVWIENGSLVSYAYRKKTHVLDYAKEFFSKDKKTLIQHGIPELLIPSMSEGKVYALEENTKLSEDLLKLLSVLIKV
jgi:tRNA nucleotidyltransferase (CCA-adding enzyme)